MARRRRHGCSRGRSSRAAGAVWCTGRRPSGRRTTGLGVTAFVIFVSFAIFVTAVGRWSGTRWW